MAKNQNFLGTHFIADPDNPTTRQLVINADGSINVVGGASSNLSVGPTGAAAPTSATLIGWIDGGGNLQGPSAANPLPVSASFSATDMLNETGTQSAAATLFTVANVAGYYSVQVQITAFAAGSVIVAEQSNDGTTWVNVVEELTGAASMTATGEYLYSCSAKQFRVRQSVYGGAGSTTVNANLRGAPQIRQVFATQTGAWTVTANAGTNLNTSALNLEATQSAFKSANHTDLAQINTTLGSPFQAGGSIGNTSFGVTQATAANLNAQVVGPTAASVAIAANPVTTGGRAATANPTAAADGQVVNAMLDKVGRQVSTPVAPRQLVGTQKTTISNSTAETTIVNAIASTFNDIVSIKFANTGITGTKVDIRDTTGGSIVDTFMVPAGDTRGQSYTVPFPQTSVNTNWTAQCAKATTAMEITVQYAKNI